MAVLMAAFSGAPAMAEDTPDEAALIAILESDADWLAKQTACRALRQSGTAKAVPALAALLNDPELSNLARYALEPMDNPEAGKALRDALNTTEGLLKSGVIGSIGARQDSLAVPLLLPLLDAAELDVASAAAGALGRIATQEAAEKLLAAYPDADPALRPAIAEGLLAAGQYMMEGDRRQKAAALFQQIIDGDFAQHARLGAFYGLAFAQPKQAPQRLIDALAGDDPQFRGTAARVIAETAGEQRTREYADVLPKLPYAGQAALLNGLARRGDPVARPAVLDVLGSADKAVQLAALNALGVLGSAQDVPLLASLLISDDTAVAGAANEALLALGGDLVDTSLADVFSSIPALRVKTLEVLAGRRAPQALSLAIQSLGDPETAVQRTAIANLGLLGGLNEYPLALQALLGAPDAEGRSAVERSLSAIGARCGDAAIPLLLEAMGDAKAEVRPVLLRLLARHGGPQALDSLVAGLNDPEEAYANEALRLLSEWPEAAAAPHLLELARSDDLNRKLLGLRGYVRLAGLHEDNDTRTGMLREATQLVQRPEEKMIVLSGWGALHTETSLEVLLPFLDDADVQTEAAAAILNVTAGLGKRRGVRDKVTGALDAVIEKCDNESISDRAKQALADLP